MAQDDYKPLGFYENNLGNIQDGFGTFSEGDEHYFTYNVGNQVYLISEGYSSAAARDNGINSVKNNMENPDRYKYDVDDNGNHYFSLRAGNNQEIATSRWFGSANDAQNGASTVRGGTGAGTTTFTGDMVAAGGAASISIASAAPAGPPKPKKKRKKRTTPKKPKKEKVYLQDGNYPINGVHYKIFRSGNDKHYFTFHKEDGKTIFLNADVRGFETEAQAKAMVDEVFKYGPVESNYEGKETRNGKYYFYLKGAEGKNIAKSFFYGSTDDMQKAVGLMLGAGVPTAAAAPAAAAAVTEKKAESTERAGQDEYLNCDEYKGKTADKNGFASFEKGGQFYFALVDNTGKVRLRSQGYTSEAGRDNGIESVIKNRGNDDRWSVAEENGKYFSILKAGNHQEIGRSCPYNDKGGAAWKWSAPVAAAAAAPVAAAAAAPKAEVKKEVAAKTGQDEYLHCDAYKGKSADKNGFASFEKGGQYYFALLDNKGNVRLRSQGYTSESGRDNGIESVIKNRGLKERWSVEEEKGKYFSILKAGNHQEIGRSCPYSDKGAAGWKWAAPAAAATAMAAAPKIVKKETPPPPPPKKVVKKETPPPPKKVVKAVKKEKIAPVKAAPVKAAAAKTAAASGGKGCAWLWWLLPLLLLLGLIWFLLKGCDGCNKAAPIVPVKEVVEEVKEVVAPVDTIDREAERKAAEEKAKAEEAARVRAAKEERERALEEQRRRGGNKSTGF